MELGYTGSRFDLLNDFYLPCLARATRYERSVGYFRSSIYVLTGVAFSEFAQRGGRCRIICSPEMEEADVEAIDYGTKAQEICDQAVQREFNEILQIPEYRPAVRFLATLVARGVLDFRLAFREAKGIFHDKLGIFQDSAGEVVSFIGTVNETFSGWSRDGNHENFEVFQSWMEGDRSRIQRHREYFESIWNDKEDGILTLGFPDGARDRIVEYADPDGIDPAAQKLKNTVIKALPDLTGKDPISRRGYDLQPHQKTTVEAWREANYRGIIKHATGAGKTVTALEAIKHWVRRGRPALVIVPSVLLAQQWVKEARIHLGEIDPALLEAGGDGKKSVWSRFLADYTTNALDAGPRIVIATVQTAVTEDFLSLIRGGPHLLVVADEVHRLGAATFQRVFEIYAGGRLGLSATPERYGDPQGTVAIRQYFGEILQPVITLSDAIAAGRLVPYDYYIHETDLAADEQREWDDLSRDIRRVYAQLPETSSGEKQQSEHLKHLLINRARIVKNAVQKVPLAAEIITTHYRDGERWLVYCDNKTQLRKVVNNIRDANSNIEVMEYHSAMKGSREETMKFFQNFSGIMVSIKCLDEGVDIPNVNSALILASSANPREFVQRRGRVLRRIRGKYSATIRDVLVRPNLEVAEVDVLSLLVTEIRRASEFAKDARNRAALITLRVLTRELGLDPKDIDMPEISFEPDDGGESDVD